MTKQKRQKDIDYGLYEKMLYCPACDTLRRYSDADGHSLGLGYLNGHQTVFSLFKRPKGTGGHVEIEAYDCETHEAATSLPINYCPLCGRKFFGEWRR
jgi:hypothetical protein